jgi:hypothetical protein
VSRLRLQGMRNAKSINNRYLLTQHRYSFFGKFQLRITCIVCFSLYEDPQGTIQYPSDWNIIDPTTKTDCVSFISPPPFSNTSVYPNKTGILEVREATR